MWGMRSYTKVPTKLGKRIKKLRDSLKITQDQLAEKVNISTVYIGYIEQGRNAPSLDVLNKIAKVLKTSPSKLLS